MIDREKIREIVRMTVGIHNWTDQFGLPYGIEAFNENDDKIYSNLSLNKSEYITEAISLLTQMREIEVAKERDNS